MLTSAGGRRRLTLSSIDHRTYPDYLARDIGDFIVVLTTETGRQEVDMLLELAAEDGDLDDDGFGLGFDQPDDQQWPPRGNPA